MSTLFASPNLTDHFIEQYPQTPGVYVFATEHKKGRYIKCKIGVTQHLPIRHRKKELDSGDRLVIYHFIPCEDIRYANGLESILHEEYKYQKSIGEWFWLHLADLRLISKCKDQFTWWRELYPEGQMQSVRALKASESKEWRA